MNELLHRKVHACQMTDAATVRGISQDPPAASFPHPRYTRQTTHYVVYKAEVPKVGRTRSAYVYSETIPPSKYSK